MHSTRRSRRLGPATGVHRQQPARSAGNSRGGFTLIELMIVVVIISILAGFIVPAVMGAMQRARIGQVVTDIKGLEAAISEFKLRYGHEPPSSIVLCQDASQWASEPDSMRKIRQLWPQFDFTKDRNIDGHGPAEPKLALDGAECLLFFLGGVRDPGQPADVWVPTGFSKNPYDPFAPGGTRVGPFFEFEFSRIRDTDGDHVPEYLDPLAGQTKPYLYVSSYGGQGYNTTVDLGGRMSDVYRQSNGGPAWQSRGFQIISPGQDGEYGTGGEYQPEKADSLLSGGRSVEQDNITNFHGNTLGS